MGGSSTFGIPMHYGSKTYSAILQRLLDEGRPAEKYEVLNGGIPGFGIWQINEALESVVVHDKPDVVVLCAWYNDSSYVPGWYGYPGLSDYEAYTEVRRLRAIENNRSYRILTHSRAYAVFRGSLSALLARWKPAAPTPGKKRKRTSPQEFKLGVEKFLELTRKHNIQPVFLFEVLNRTANRKEAVAKNRYYRVLEELGADHQVPIVDSLSPIAERKDEWFFYDFIHPNEHGHEAIADSVYQSFFSPEWHTQRSLEFFRSKGVYIPPE
jgi:lysophospholipase L1-like esterase